MKRILQFMYSIYAIITFIILMLIVFPFVLVFSLIKNKRSGNLIYDACRIWAKVWYILIFVRHKKIYASSYDKTKQYIFVANHITYMDIPQLLLATSQPIRVLARHDLAHIPIFGSIYTAAAILVNRENKESRIQSLIYMQDALRDGLSLFIFPEGTFNESGNTLKSFHDGAFRLSVSTGIPIKPIVFPDTIKRLRNDNLFSFSPGISRTVYLEEVNPATFSDTQSFKEKVFDDMKNALDSYQKTT